MPKLIVIDGNSIANRAFYALPLLSNSQGLHTNAVYGFTTMLLRLIEEQQPTHFLVAFDAGKVTFRHKDYTEYKGGRAKTPPELSEQFPLIKELLAAFQIPQFELDGYEADDIIGTLTRLADEIQMEVLVVTGDKDMLQLASEHVKIALTRKGISEVELFGPEQIHEKYGLEPRQIIDLKGLMGDASDNIPGIPGVGEKTALKLLHEYGSVENVIAHVNDLKGKMKEKIGAHSQDALMSKELATIFREVPMEADWDKLRYEGYDPNSLQGMFRKLEFKSLLEKMDFSGAGSTEQEQAPKESFNVSVVSDSAGIAALAGALSDVLAVHVEVVGDNPHTSDVLGLAFYTEGTAYYVPFDILTGSDASDVRRWLESAEKSVPIYDLHRAKVVLGWKGIELNGFSFDILLAAYLLDPTESALTLDGLAAKYGLPGLPSDEAVFGKGAKFQVPPQDVLSEYICQKAAAVYRLMRVLQENLENNGMHELFYDLELPLAAVLAQMERQGIRVDADALKEYGEELAVQLDRIMKNIHELAGTEFNINSPKQLGEILFEKLGLPVLKKTKTGYSTDAEVLEKLEPYHPIIGQILHYRTLAKLQSTYVEGLLKEVRPESRRLPQPDGCPVNIRICKISRFVLRKDEKYAKCSSHPNPAGSFLRLIIRKLNCGCWLTFPRTIS
jgi:DNA polymerase-1